MTPEQRAIRKSLVFHVIYGTHCGLSEAEESKWRTMAAEYINGQRDLRDMPLAANGLLEALAAARAPRASRLRGEADTLTRMSHLTDLILTLDEIATTPHPEDSAMKAQIALNKLPAELLASVRREQ